MLGCRAENLLFNICCVYTFPKLNFLGFNTACYWRLKIKRNLFESMYKFSNVSIWNANGWVCVVLPENNLMWKIKRFNNNLFIRLWCWDERTRKLNIPLFVFEFDKLMLTYIVLTEMKFKCDWAVNSEIDRYRTHASINLIFYVFYWSIEKTKFWFFISTGFLGIITLE